LPVGNLVTPRNRLAGEQPDGEVWTIINTGGWAHPVHIHHEEFQILWRNGKAPLDNEKSKKDVLRLDPGQEVQIYLRFRDFLGKYPIHCHNVVHEDHSMMLRFDVVGDY
jgi:FtsP/CotA-like multicopper oxidase with cupredoxin domain